ncbi:MAG: RluA family pseudouridine synthase [Planctomycetaceae bacterium]
MTTGSDVNPGMPDADHVCFVVERCYSGIRIDSFLSRHLRNYTPWRLMRLVEAGAVRVNDMRAEWDQRVSAGQMVTVRLTVPPDQLLLPLSRPFPIVYEDPWLLVVDKPIGLVAHPVGEFQDGTLSNILQAHLDQQTWAPGLLRPGIVHRLDRMTSGLLVVAKDQKSHRELSADFQNGRMSKSYLAIVEGRPAFHELSINRAIGHRPGGRSVLMSAADNALNARTARTDVTVIRQFRNACLVSCRLHTGRNHQIRVHLSHVGHPILGDDFYGPHDTLKPTSHPDASATTTRHALHAAQLAFHHPILRADLTFRSSPPPDFFDLLSAHSLM